MREETEDRRGRRSRATPPGMPGSHLILIDVDRPRFVLGHHRSIEGSHGAGRVKLFNEVGVGPCRLLARIGAYENKDVLGHGHVVKPLLA